MKASLRGPAAHYFVFINISLTSLLNQDPMTAEKLQVNTFFRLGQQHNGWFTNPQTLNDNGLSTTGMRSVSGRLSCCTFHFLCLSFSVVYENFQDDTFKGFLFNKLAPYFQGTVSVSDRLSPEAHSFCCVLKGENLQCRHLETRLFCAPNKQSQHNY